MDDQRVYKGAKDAFFLWEYNTTRTITEDERVTVLMDQHGMKHGLNTKHGMKHVLKINRVQNGRTMYIS